MGFPVGYGNIVLPKLLLHLLTILEFIRKLCHAVFSILGLGNLFEIEHETTSYSHQARNDHSSGSVSAVLIREFLPVMRFSADMDDPTDNCAVCLYEFRCDDEIRRLINCRHVFHRSCVDRWMDHDRKTCPLCRKHFIPVDMQEAFNERLWVESGISDYYTDHSPITTAF